MRRGADYDYEVRGKFLVIIDLDIGGLSVTNDIENVLERIKDNLSGNLPDNIIYRDSDLRYDGVLYKDGKIGFILLGATTAEEAMALMEEKCLTK
jgi:hypothetical protein